MDAMNCTCGQCGNEFVSFRNGKKFCSKKCYRNDYRIRNELVRQKIRDCKCPICGIEFVTRINSKVYCTRKCNTEAHRLRHQGIQKEYELKSKERAPKFSSVSFNSCLTCGKRFVSQRKRKYCGDQCLPSEEKRLAAADSLKERHAEKCCIVCGKPCGYTFGRSKVYCSKECRQQSETHKEGKRAAKAVRRARIKGVTVETVKPFKVFERDRWRCQLCGIKTPKNRRNTILDNAPELDHIVPISKGGDHSYRNTHCACRKCNQEKSNTPRGQMLLIG